MSQFVKSGGQNIGVSASASVLPRIFRTDFLQDGLLDLLAVQGTLKSLLQHHSSKTSIFQHSALYSPTLTSIHDYWKNHSLDQMGLFGKVMSLFFNMLSRLVITFLPRSKHLLISWLQSPSVVILEPPQNKVCHCFGGIVMASILFSPNLYVEVLISSISKCDSTWRYGLYKGN